jgi:DNA-binding transcriptional ArsR family regulator
MGVEDAARALALPRRREILRLVRDDERSVGEIAEHFDISRPAISQHLRVLKEARLVADEPRGNRRLYRIDPVGFDSLRDYLDRFWTHALDRFKKRAESSAPQRRRKHVRES